MSVTLKMGAEPSNLVLGMSLEIGMSAAAQGFSSSHSAERISGRAKAPT